MSEKNERPKKVRKVVSMVRAHVATTPKAPVNQRGRLWRGRKFDESTGVFHDDPFRMLYGTPEEARTRIRAVEAKSDALPDDPFMGSYGVSAVGACPILYPPDDPRYMASLVKVSASLRACVDAQVQSVVGYGHELVPRPGMEPATDDEKLEREDERLRLEDFFDNIHPHMSWAEMQKRRETDCEAIGRGFLEVIDSLDKETGESELFGFDHIPSRNMRLSTEDGEPVLAKAWRWDRAKKAWQQIEYYHRFRRYVNLATNLTGKTIIRYFAEFGDPRFVDKNTGAFLTRRGEDGKDEWVMQWKDLTDDQKKVVTNQIWPKFVYDPEQPQGSPRWKAAQTDIEAAHSSREAVLDYLDNGAIPQLLLMVSGGAAFEDVVERVESALDRTKGNHAANRVVVIDAVTVQSSKSGALPSDDLSDGPSRIKIEALKLNDLQRGDDAMFLKFRERVDLDVRKCFRFGSVFVGDNDGATYATAEVILQLAEMQCFAPARTEDDWRMNHLVFPRLRAKWWLYRSKGPRIENPDSWIRVVELGVGTGAIRDYPTLCSILSEKLGRTLEVPVDDKGNPLEWTKLPPGFVKALVLAIRAMPGATDIDGAVAGIQGAPAASVGRGVDALAVRFADAADAARKILEGRRPG